MWVRGSGTWVGRGLTWFVHDERMGSVFGEHLMVHERGGVWEVLFGDSECGHPCVCGHLSDVAPSQSWYEFGFDVWFVDWCVWCWDKQFSACVFCVWMCRFLRGPHAGSGLGGARVPVRMPLCYSLFIFAFYTSLLSGGVSRSRLVVVSSQASAWHGHVEFSLADACVHWVCVVVHGSGSLGSRC